MSRVVTKQGPTVSGNSQMPRQSAVVAAALVLSLTAPAGAEEPRLLESAARLAAVTRLQQTPPDTCAVAAARGAEAAGRRQRRVGWLLGSVLLPVVLPVAAYVSAPTPPLDVLADVSRQDLACFSAGYANAAQRRRARAAWIGTGIGIGLLVAAALAERRQECHCH